MRKSVSHFLQGIIQRSRNLKVLWESMELISFLFYSTYFWKTPGKVYEDDDFSPNFLEEPKGIEYTNERTVIIPMWHSKSNLRPHNLHSLQKCDMDSHENSMPFPVINRRQFGPKWHNIPWLFHVIYPGFICCPCKNMTWILHKSKSWNFPWHLLRNW